MTTNIQNENEPKQKQKQKPNPVTDFMMRLGVLGELLLFLWQRKLYWLLPMVIVLFLFAFIIILGSSGAGGAFIYVFF